VRHHTDDGKPWSRLQGQARRRTSAPQTWLVAWRAVARRRGLWGMASLLAPLVLAGLILMHGLDAGAVQSMADAGHEMVASHAAHVEGTAVGDHGCDGCHLAGHITVMCVAALVSVALWHIRPVRLSETGANQSPPGRRSGGAGPPRPVPRGQPAWLELSVILR
jgi:hypothetical protein